MRIFPALHFAKSVKNTLRDLKDSARSVGAVSPAPVRSAMPVRAATAQRITEEFRGVVSPTALLFHASVWSFGGEHTEA